MEPQSRVAGRAASRLLPALARAGGLMLLLIGASCAGRPNSRTADIPDCRGLDALSERVLGEDLQGEYRLSMEATRGPMTGHVTTGSLRLLPFPDTGITKPPWVSDGNVEILLYGGTEILPQEVGAVVNGSVQALDPAAAGVLMIQQLAASPQAGVRVTVRLGSKANRLVMPAIEGPYTALTVLAMDSTAFSGTWSSGQVDEEAGGEFCARRIPSGG